MPEIPQEAVSAAVDEIMRRRGLTADHSRAWAEPIVRDALEAAAPVMAEAVAQRILAHMDAHVPNGAGFTGSPGGTLRRAWRRHFRIAAQVAALAFSTPEDVKRMAGEALERGDIMACPALDDQREDEDRD